MTSEPDRHAPSDPENWVDLHGDAVYRYARARVRTRDIAEELVQETLLAAFKARDRFSGRSTERTWLIGILRNKIVDHYRRRGREVPASELAGDDDIMADLFDERGRWRHPPSAWEGQPDALLQRGVSQLPGPFECAGPRSALPASPRTEQRPG